MSDLESGEKPPQEKPYFKIEYDPEKQEFGEPVITGPIPLEMLIGQLYIIQSGLVGSWAMQKQMKRQEGKPVARPRGGLIVPGGMPMPNLREPPPGYEHH